MKFKAKPKNSADYDDWWIEPRMAFEVFGQIIKVWQGETL